MKDFMGKCDICLVHRDSQVQEKLLQQEVPPRSWAKVAADICFHLGRTLLVVVHYFSNFIQVDSLSSETSKSVIRSLMATFADLECQIRWSPIMGLALPRLSSRNLQTSGTFSMLLRVSGTREVMARLRMPFVLLTTVERLFTKRRAAGVSKFQALLDWRNTPCEGMDTIHAQSLLGRRCTLLPTSGTLLTSELSLVNDAAKLGARKERQRRYFNRGKHVLSPVKTGETIRVRSPSGTWRPAECLREVAPRAY